MKGFPDRVIESDVVVIGAGVAGLSAALGLASQPGVRLSVALLTKTRLGTGGASAWAQGGIAAAVGEDDSPRLHAADTLAAGAGLNDPAIVELLTAEGAASIDDLLALGVAFDRDRAGRLDLGREAAHSRRRILHAHGDATGAELVRALTAAVRTAPGVAIFEETFACELVTAGGRVAGVLALAANGAAVLYLGRAVVLATGGCGQVFRATTNPKEATGDGLALAARAGARLADLEMVQFHPTALAVGADPMPLLTEALRGEGAVLVDGRGRRFMLAEHPGAELAPRDVVARALFRRLAAGEQVFLDAREAVGEAFPARFPTVFGHCRRAGIDPRRELLPVAPAAHYHMGGIAVEADGRSSLPGLWACGEVASTGAHGANRLASNSLLEAQVFGARAAEDVACHLPPAVPATVRGTRPAPQPAGASLDLRAAIRELMTAKVGVERSGAGLEEAVWQLDSWARSSFRVDGETRNLLTVGRLIAAAALARQESRGSHYRTDFPAADPAWQRRLMLTLSPSGEVVVEGAAGAGPRRAPAISSFLAPAPSSAVAACGSTP